MILFYAIYFFINIASYIFLMDICYFIKDKEPIKAVTYNMNNKFSDILMVYIIIFLLLPSILLSYFSIFITKLIDSKL